MQWHRMVVSKYWLVAMTFNTGVFRNTDLILQLWIGEIGRRICIFSHFSSFYLAGNWAKFKTVCFKNIPFSHHDFGSVNTSGAKATSQ